VSSQATVVAEEDTLADHSQRCPRGEMSRA